MLTFKHKFDERGFHTNKICTEKRKNLLKQSITSIPAQSFEFWRKKGRQKERQRTQSQHNFRYFRGCRHDGFTGLGEVLREFATDLTKLRQPCCGNLSIHQEACSFYEQNPRPTLEHNIKMLCLAEACAGGINDVIHALALMQEVRHTVGGQRSGQQYISPCSETVLVQCNPSFEKFKSLRK